MDSRYSIDPKVFLRETNKWLNLLTQIAEPLKESRFTECLEAWKETMEDRLNQPYTIVVCGEFNRGKSSLINAILGEDIAPVDILPETTTFNTISWGEHRNEAILSGGRSLILSDDELKRERLAELVIKQGKSLKQLVLKRPNPALKELVIIDTPGLNDRADVDDELMKQTMEKADAVVYVISVESPLSLTEQSFLQNIVLPNRTASLFVVCNKTDYISLSQLDRVKEMIACRSEQLLPGLKIHYLSAIAERARQKGKTVGSQTDCAWLNQLFDSFRSAYENDFKLRKDVLTVSRAEHLVAICAEKLEKELQIIELGLQADLQAVTDNEREKIDAGSQMKEDVSHLKEELSRQIQEAKTRAQNELAEVVRKMRAEADLLDDFDEDDIEKYYPFYCVDVARSVLTTRMEQDTEELYKAVQACSSLNSLRLPRMSVPDFGFDLDCRVWTKGDTFAYAGGWFFRGKMLQLLTDYLGGLFREREVSRQVVSLKERILDIFPLFWKSISESIGTVYDAFGKEVLEQAELFLFEQEKETEAQRLEIERINQLDAEKKRQTAETTEKLRREVMNMKRELI